MKFDIRSMGLPSNSARTYQSFRSKFGMMMLEVECRSCEICVGKEDVKGNNKTV